MSPGEFARLIEWIETSWVGTKAWKNHTDLYPEYAGFVDADVWEAARNAFHNGSRYAPTPSELWKAATVIHKAKGRTSEQVECVKHVWGIHEEDEDGWRLGVCAVCQHEARFPPGRLLTDSEIIDKAMKKRELV